jgi:hypothetical protein
MNNKEKQNIDFLHLPVPKITSENQIEFKIPSQIKKKSDLNFLDNLLTKKFLDNYFKL